MKSNGIETEMRLRNAWVKDASNFAFFWGGGKGELCEWASFLGRIVLIVPIQSNPNNSIPFYHIMIANSYSYKIVRLVPIL